MGANSSIEWTDSTWNPIRARLPGGRWGYHCEHVSPGCQHCYAETMNGRMLPAWGTGLKYNVPNREKVEIFLDETELFKPLHWKKPRKIFVGSMTDIFADFVPDAFIDRMFAVMALCPQHTFQVLTKRSKQMSQYLSKDIEDRLDDHCHEICGSLDETWHYPAAWPLPNVWLGISVEDEVRKSRIDILRNTPAAIRFLSIEPLLEDIGVLDLSGISWVIIGGESGPGARPFDLQWARDIIKQCKAANVPVFCKQVGAVPVDTNYKHWGSRMRIGDGNPEYNKYIRLSLKDRKGGEMSEWPVDLRERQMPK